MCEVSQTALKILFFQLTLHPDWCSLADTLNRGHFPSNAVWIQDRRNMSSMSIVSNAILPTRQVHTAHYMIAYIDPEKVISMSAFVIAERNDKAGMDKHIYIFDEKCHFLKQS